MKYLALLLPVAAWALPACDNIDTDERWEEKVPVEIKKNVLIEDFTGQKCINCPAATDIIHQLQQGKVGAHIIAVGIHTTNKEMGYSVDESPIGLATAIGEKYNQDWGVNSWPIGMVDRKGGLLNDTKWVSAAVKRLQLEPEVEMQLSTSYDGNVSDTQWGKAGITVTLSEKKAGALKNAYVNVWITEGSIVALQYMPDGSMNAKYVHQHVLRDVLTPAYGEPVLSQDTEGMVSCTFSYDIPKIYGMRSKTDVQNMAVVAFVTKGEKGEVMQVEEARIVATTETE